ncbi:uncharacterized protein DFL_007189 [Arthrobotrys flagrans]|uniref:Uncharacterized protein n=1 Tax=Arthrobotrys flagrans TaxID=97331 RepID=A0A436ZVI8_ARTFL|nr:hypothetical protein DFL_007189 [Arthrobotrys flagrans]
MNREYLPWVALGIGCVFAYKLTIYQLESFKRQCEILPEESRETVDKATENALKLDTLATLSRGVNYNLSRAAIRIIAERALTDATFPTLLRHCISSNPTTRHTSLKTLRFLILGKSKSENYYENDNDHVLSKESEQILYSQPAGNSTSTLIRALNAGIVLYMKCLPSPGYPNIIAAFSDGEYQPPNYFLYDIHNWMLNHDDADDYLEALKKAELYVERPKVIMGMRGGVSGTFERQVQEFHRTLRERYPTAVSVEEALEFAAAEGMTFENGEAVAGGSRGGVWQ